MAMASSPLPPVTESTPAANLALIAMVVVLSKVWPPRTCALAVNRVEWSALARWCSGMHNGRAALQNYFCYRQSRYGCNAIFQCISAIGFFTLAAPALAAGL